jgi:cyanophycin synthetase
VSLRVQRWWCRIARTAARTLGRERTVYVDARVAEYRQYWEAAARILGGTLTPLSEGIWEVRVGRRSTRIFNYVVGIDDAVTLRVAGDKLFCHRVAQEVGVPVPEYLAFALAEVGRAQAYLRDHPGAYVVKPAYGSASGLGITTHVRTARQLKQAALLASLFGDRLLLERMVPGESYRLLFLDGRLLHAARRTGERVAGDGLSTVRELVERAGVGPVDPAMADLLETQRLEAESVPESGRAVLVRAVPRSVRRTRELRTVYDASVTGLFDKDTIRSLEALVRRLGSRFAGIDLVTSDPTVPLEESGGAFLELNTTPGIHHHYHTEEEWRSHPVAVQVLRHLLDD